MRTLVTITIVLGVFVGNKHVNCSNIFEVPCGMGCADSTCYIGTGCGNCIHGWCLNFYDGQPPFCMPTCPKGKTCQDIGPLRMCYFAPSTTTPTTTTTDFDWSVFGRR